MNIISLISDDWKLLRDIRLKALADCPDAFTATLEEELQKSEDDWRERLATNDWRTFVAVIDNKPAGMVCGGTINGQTGLFSMWVDPQFRGQEVADTLIKSVIEWAKTNGSPSLFLGVADINTPAIRLYERHGFHPTGQVSTLPPPRTHIREHERILVFTAKA